jgi:hypothetical protein
VDREVDSPLALRLAQDGAQVRLETEMLRGSVELRERGRMRGWKRSSAGGFWRVDHESMTSIADAAGAGMSAAG